MMDDGRLVRDASRDGEADGEEEEDENGGGEVGGYGSPSALAKTGGTRPLATAAATKGKKESVGGGGTSRSGGGEEEGEEVEIEVEEEDEGDDEEEEESSKGGNGRGRRIGGQRGDSLYVGEDDEDEGGGGCCGSGGKRRKGGGGKQYRGGEVDDWAQKRRIANLRSGRDIGQSQTLKFVLLGDSSVGKSSLSTRWVLGIFKEQVATMGVTFLSKKVEIEGVTLNIEIWDTAGQERFRSLTPMYYRGAHCAICVYDIANKQSFRGMDSWIKELKDMGPSGLAIAVVGNKVDLEGMRQVSKEELLAYVEGHGIEVAAEASALEGRGVEAFFMECCRACVKPPNTK